MSSAISSAPFSKSPSFHLWWLGQSFIIPDLSVWQAGMQDQERDGWMGIERRTLTPSNVDVVGSILCKLGVIRRYQRLLITD